MGLYDEEVSCWLANHSFFFVFWWALAVAIIALILSPLEIVWAIKKRIRR